MSNRLGEFDLQEAAQLAAGNWMKFDSFVWFRADDLDDADNWAVLYTHHRDSGLLDQSNAAVISKELAPFTEGDDPDVVFESHSHWAVGHVDGFSVRVFRDGHITDAFRRYHQLAEAMAEYPILDESDYSERELEATVENIGEAAWRLKGDYDLPDDWQYEVYSWLSENEPSEIENVDDQGGYPSEESLRRAFDGLGFEQSAVTV